MRIVFADTHYWVALTNPGDEWHEAAKRACPRLGITRIVTTDEVLAEFLTFLSRYGPELREIASRLVRATLANPNVSVHQQTRDSFLTGLNLFEQRRDKKYSLTDCISMQAMRRDKIEEVLTHDHHFTQEGFTVLLIDKNL